MSGTNGTTTTDEEKDVVLSLLPVEQQLSRINRWMTMTTVTWFSGNHTTAVSFLEQRVRAMLIANPWLAGRLAHQCSKPVVLHPSSSQLSSNMSTHLNKHLFHIVDSNKSPWNRNTPLDELPQHGRSFVAKTAKLLWKISIVPCRENPNEYFALVHSMSHVIGDGHTYYNLHNMLTRRTSEVVALIEERIFETLELQNQAIGENEGPAHLFGLGFSVASICGWWKTVLMAPLRLAPKMQRKYFDLDKEDMDAAKTSAMNQEVVNGESASINEHDGKANENVNKNSSNDGVSFVSTNDVLTSWFFRQAQCSFGLMALNFRNRLENHTEAHAGNYEATILYYPPDYGTPRVIRQSLLQSACQQDSNNGADQPTIVVKRAVTHSTTSTPSLWKHHLRGSYALITNWSSFQQDADLGGDFREEEHLPLIENFTAPNHMSLGIIFRCAPNHRLAFLVIANSEVVTRVEDAPFFKAYTRTID